MDAPAKKLNGIIIGGSIKDGDHWNASPQNRAPNSQFNPEDVMCYESHVQFAEATDGGTLVVCRRGPEFGCREKMKE